MEINEACINCCYFRPKKGHFGTCEGFGSVYDGSKKGTSCLNFRLKPLLYKPITTNNSIKVPECEEYTSLRKLYNSKHRKSWKATHATNVDGEFVTFTSDIHFKNGYAKHRYNYIIIDTCLTLFLNNKTYQEISNYLKNSNMRVPCRRTLRTWVKTFLGVNAWNERYSTPNLKCYCGGNMVKDGKACSGTYEQYKCKSCNKKKTLRITH